MKQRLIDASALRAVWAEKERNYPAFVKFRAKEVLESIDAAPTIDAAPVIPARWVNPDPFDEWETFICSNCGALGYGFGTDPYCPHCGARMDAEEVGS